MEQIVVANPIVLAVQRTMSKAYLAWWASLIASLPILVGVLLITWYSKQYQLAFYITAALILVFIPVLWMTFGFRKATITY